MAAVEQASEPENTSLRDELAKALAASRARDESPAADVSEEEPEPEVQAEPETEESETVTVEAEAEAEPELSEGPTWLPKEDRELFAQAPENVRAAWERNFKGLQSNYTRATQELKEKGERLSRFDQVLSAVRPIIQQNGLTDEQAIGYLVNQYRAYAQNPLEYSRALAKSVGLSLDTTNAPGFDSGLDDPRIRALEQRLGQVQQTVVISQRQQQALEEQKINRQLTEFAEGKDADGNLLRPHFERVQTAMVPFVSSGLSLEKAYEKAVRADDELFEQIVAERSRKALQKPAVKKVATKPKASGSGMAQPKTFSDMNLREELAARLKGARASS